MNKIPLNIAGLDGGVIIRKGGGGGVTINNQEKSLDITENGTTEVTADAGFTGLSKVIVNTNVASSGGGGGSDMPVIGDGKTYLYINIAAEGRMNVPLYFSQTIANGVTIDWGDGSAPQTLSGTGNVNTTHKYAAIGDYVISLDPVDGCTLGLGTASSTATGVLGSSSVYRSRLKYVEMGNSSTFYDGTFRDCHALLSVVISSSVTNIGNSAFNNCHALSSVVVSNGVTSIGSSAFYNCFALLSVVMPDSLTSIGSYAFNGCHSLASVVIPNSVTSIEQSAFRECYALSSAVIPSNVTSIGNNVFNNCSSLASVVIPNGITSIGNYAFQYCTGMAFYDFSSHASVPSLSNTNAFSNIPSDCKIIVPDALYDEWIAATNWSTYASKIIKKSDWDAQS